MWIGCAMSTREVRCVRGAPGCGDSGPLYTLVCDLLIANKGSLHMWSHLYIFSLHMVEKDRTAPSADVPYWPADCQRHCALATLPECGTGGPMRMPLPTLKPADG